jgi:hypothetical protein
MIAGLGDNRPAITMADQNNWPVHRVDGRLRIFLVVGVGSFGVLHHRYLVSIVHEDCSDRFPAGTVGESSMYQNHIMNTLCHRHSPLQ